MVRGPICQAFFALRDKPDLCKNYKLDPSLLTIVAQNPLEEKAPGPADPFCPPSNPHATHFAPSPLSWISENVPLSASRKADLEGCPYRRHPWVSRGAKLGV